jgi:membrane fusion protein, heavy metal efflux system
MNRKQKITVLAIVLISLVLGALIMAIDRPSASREAHHAHESEAGAKATQAHEDGHAHAEEEKTIRLTDAQITAAGITLATAGPMRIKSGVQLPGEIKFNEDRTAHVVPRITGIVESVHADLGQQVRKGQLLAVVNSTDVSERRSEYLTARQRHELTRTTFLREKKLWEEKISAEQDYLLAQQAMREAEIALRNAQQKLQALGADPTKNGALNRFEIRAPFNGTVVEKHITLGESLKEDARVFTITDLSTVWAEIAVPPNQLNLVRVGETATVTSAAFDATVTGKVTYVGALLGERTRTASARVVLPNPQGAWRPGLFVSLNLYADEGEVPVAVPADAVQTVDNKTVVFVREGEGFVPQPVKTGRTDGKLIEVLSGVKPGARVANTNSFVLKSELGKAGAEHAH